jgi:ABC-type nitrate/sulfonate/bicarbonate transport system substrate-binding protein
MSIFRPYRQLFNTTLAIFTVVTVLCISSACKPSQRQSGPPEKMTIAYSTASNAILVYIAFANEYFKEEGLDATPQPHSFGKLALNAVIEGKADLATAGDTPLVLSIMAGKMLSTIAVIQRSSRNEAIVARQDRGISKPADLSGKKIGVTFGTTGDFFADSFLVVHGIKRDQVRFIDMKPDEMAGALDTGRVDAVSTWNPTLSQLGRDLGNKGITFYGGEFYTETFCLAGSREYIQRHPEAISKVLRALIKAETFAKQRPDEARRLVANFIKTDKSVLDEIWDIFNLRVTLDQALLLNFEEQSRWAVKNRLIPDRTTLNYLDFIYVEGLQAVKPEAVRIIR